MAMFLTGDAVRSNVDRVIASDDVCLAVAFWGQGRPGPCSVVARLRIQVDLQVDDGWV